jgi:prepilin-type processing-associated H-X9-DG protein
LVVIAIIGIVLVLIVSAVQQSRAAARRMTCQANLKQWTLAALRYTEIHKGALPRRGQGVQPTMKFDRPDDWFNALPPLMDDQPLLTLIQTGAVPKPGDHSVWVCPDFPETAQPAYFEYGMNMWLSTSKGANPDSIDKVGATSTMVIFADASGTQCSVLPSAQPYSPVDRHNGSVNLAFLDGHVKAFAGEYVGCGNGIPERTDIRWIVPDSPWAGP